MIFNSPTEINVSKSDPVPALSSRGLPASTPLQPRRRAILVGASGGIGSALARRLVREGYVLALVDREAKALETLCGEINQTAGLTRAIPYLHDVTKYDTVPDTLRRIVADLGGLDLFVYLAGVIYFPALDEYNFEEDRRMVEINLLGAMAWMSEVAPLRWRSSPSRRRGSRPP